MAITKDQVMSYGISGGTGMTGWVAQKTTDAEPEISWAAHMATDIASWSAMDYLTAACMGLGAIGVLHRMYVDWSAHQDRKARIAQLLEERKCP